MKTRVKELYVNNYMHDLTFGHKHVHRKSRKLASLESASELSHKRTALQSKFVDLRVTWTASVRMNINCE